MQTLVNRRITVDALMSYDFFKRNILIEELNSKCITKTRFAKQYTFTAKCIVIASEFYSNDPYWQIFRAFWAFLRNMFGNPHGFRMFFIQTFILTFGKHLEFYRKFFQTFFPNFQYILQHLKNRLENIQLILWDCNPKCFPRWKNFRNLNQKRHISLWKTFGIPFVSRGCIVIHMKIQWLDQIKGKPYFGINNQPQ